MITKTAQQRHKILCFWRKHGLKATIDAFGAKRSTLYAWWKIYKESGYRIDSLNPGTQARKHNNKREIHPLLLKEIKKIKIRSLPKYGQR